MLDTLNLSDDIKTLTTRYLTEEEIIAIINVIKSYHEDPDNWTERHFYLNSRFFPSCSLESPTQGFINIHDLKPKDIYQRKIRNVLNYCNTYFIERIGRPNLENFTRDYVRRACDYVENSAKYLLVVVEPNAETGYPLGRIINVLKDKKFHLPAHLLEIAEMFNKQVYTKAKHEYTLAPNHHLYTVDEAILIYFMAKKLGTELQRLAMKTVN